MLNEFLEIPCVRRHRSHPESAPTGTFRPAIQDIIISEPGDFVSHCGHFIPYQTITVCGMDW